MILPLFLTFVFPGGALGLLFKIAIFCVIIWGAWELIKWSGITIPRPVIIILTCVLCIVVIYWLFELLQMAL